MKKKVHVVNITGMRNTDSGQLLNTPVPLFSAPPLRVVSTSAKVPWEFLLDHASELLRRDVNISQ